MDRGVVAVRPAHVSVHRVVIVCLAVAALGVALRDGLHAPSACWGALLVLSLCSAADVELGRRAEGGSLVGQRPHKGLSAWSFAAALVVPCGVAALVVVPLYAHAWWRGLRVPPWKWVGSGAIVMLAGQAGGATARALGGADARGPDVASLVDAGALAAAAVVFVVVEAALLAVCALSGDPSDEAWLRAQLRSRPFYLTELGVLAAAVVTAALLAQSPWLLLFGLPGYSMVQRAVLHEPLRRQAAEDGKTGLLNYTAWRQQVEREATRGRPGAVLLLDLDHFKEVNDRHGHLAGDAVLADVSHLLADVLRDRDVAGRFGGEEFCVLLPDTSPGDVGVVAERVRERVAGLALSVPDLRITVSVGVCFVPAAEWVLDEALAVADAALYAAKRAGRDRVAYGQPSPLPVPVAAPVPAPASAPATAGMAR